MKENIGDLFQRETKYLRAKPAAAYLRRQSRPEPNKTYPHAPRIKLDPPENEGKMPLWEALRKRRSVRHFKSAPLAKKSLSQLLWASQGVTKKTMGCEFRTAPSAGALYPVETYLSIHDVLDINPGIYHYDVRKHEIELLRRGDVRHALADASLGQEFVGAANAVFIWTAVFARSAWKYGNRAYRYIYLDAGHIAQNLALAAVSLGLGSCQVGALLDDEINSLIEVDGEEESVVYMTAVGHPA